MRDQVPDCPDFTRVKNKLLFWGKYSSHHHNLWLADPQQVLWLKLLRGQLVIPIDSLFAFSSYFFFTRSFFRNSLHDLDVPYHITVEANVETKKRWQDVKTQRGVRKSLGIKSWGKWPNPIYQNPIFLLGDVVGPFISQKTVSMTFFTDHCTWNL